MSPQRPPLILLLVVTGSVSYLALSAKPDRSPAALATTPENIAKPAAMPSRALSRGSAPPIDYLAEATPKQNPLESFWNRFKENPNQFQLSEAQLNRHVKMRGRSLDSLLTALRISDNLDYLREAYERYPDHPDLLMELAQRSGSPEERREAIEALRQADPDWGLGDYLLALEQARAGDREAAMSTFLEAGSNNFLDYTILRKSEGLEQAYLDNGFPLHQATFLGFHAVPLRDATALATLSKEMSALQADFLKNGDTASALKLAQAARSLNQKRQEEAFAIMENLTGDIFEMHLLQNLPAATDLGAGLTAGQRLADLQRKKRQIADAISVELYRGMSAQDLIEYIDLVKARGEWTALQQWRAKDR
jgi:hypothetical protein